MEQQDAEAYRKSAWDYSASLIDEDLAESTSESRQRFITMSSFSVIRVYRPDVQQFNELLIQYPKSGGGRRRISGVVPDSMIVVHAEPIVADLGFDLPFQPVGPLVVMHYIGRGSIRKDFELNKTRYEKDIKVPYYLAIYPNDQELTLYSLECGKYVPVLPNANGRRSIPELELEVGQLAGWVRYWFRGNLTLLPSELARTQNAASRRAEAERDRLRAEIDQLRSQ